MSTSKKHTKLTPFVFSELIRLVKSGLTIQKSFKFLKLDKSNAYRDMTDKQRLELRQVKSSIALCGRSGRWTNKLMDIFPNQLEEDPEY